MVQSNLFRVYLETSVIGGLNFKHLVDPRRARAFNGVNLAMGYGLVEIRSPRDIVRAVETES